MMLKLKKLVPLCLLILLAIAACTPPTASESESEPWQLGDYRSDCLGKDLELPENVPVFDFSVSRTLLETQIAESDLIVLGTIADISGSCFNQESGEYFDNGLPYFEIRLNVEEFVQNKLGLEAQELVFTQVGYSLLDDTVPSPYSVGDQVLLLVVDRELAWQNDGTKPILRPFDDFTSSLLIAQPDGTFADAAGLHTPQTLDAVRDQLTGEAGHPEQLLGCAEGGAGVFTPEDVRCYLASFEPQFVREIDEDTAVLFTDPNSIADWVGGAIIYHIPTVSSLVLDKFGDVDPQMSHVNGRAALVAYNRLAANPELMAELKQTVQQNWQTTDSGEPEVRLGLAWQNGQQSTFLIAISGLPATDARFYCHGESWTIGETQIELIPDCVAYEAGVLLRHFYFATREVRGSEPQLVQVTLNGVESNSLQVAEGEVSVETAVYEAAILYQTDAAVVGRNETTAPDLTEAEITLLNEIDLPLLESFLTVNQTSSSLDFLFADHQVIFLQPGWVVERDYLPPGGSTPDCVRFQRTYPGLSGGVISLSQIGYSEDGRQAVVYLQRECGETAVASSYLLLELQGESWTPVAEFGRVETEASAPLMPDLVFNGRAQGCGDFFLYKANDDEQLSQFITLDIDARAFGFSNEPTTIEIADYWPTPAVTIDVFGERVYNLGEFPYCNDVAPTAVPQTVWRAESGTITVTINGTIPEASCTGEGYEATVRLENIVFRNGEESVAVDEILFEDTTVGWCVG